MPSLQAYNSFKLDVQALALTEFRSQSQLKQSLKQSRLPVYILGGGSNILFTRNLHAHVLVNRLEGIKIIKESRDYCYVEVGAGVVWHELVLWSIKKGLGGIENLSLIPGCVGAAPIQNIGAYGVELKDVFIELKAMSLKNQKIVHFDRSDCSFGYRESVFKQGLKGQYCICSVTIRLRKKPTLNLSYGAIQAALDAKGIEHPTIEDVSNVVIEIRRSKLPDPAELGNAGSFFKNPVIGKEAFDALAKEYRDIPFYPVNENTVKVPAGWLIEQCGWKGKRIAEVGCYEKQALVIVNHGKATGKEIQQHALNIKKSVYQKFSIRLQNEVNIL